MTVDETRLVTLDEAAKLAKLTPEVFMQLALATADWEPGYRATIFQGPGGPWFDPVECEGLGYILDGIEDEPDQPDVY